MRRWGLLIQLATAVALMAPTVVNAQAPLERDDAQHDRAELENAQATYLEEINQLAEEHGELSIELLEPYVELAELYLLNDQPLEAITVLETARSVTQRNYGLFGLEQLPLLDELGRAWLLLGDTMEAQEIQRERLNVALRRFGEDDPRTIPYRNQLADYYDLSRMRILAREEYEAVLDIQREAFGDDDGRLLVPLSEMVAIDIRLGDGTAARRRMQQVLESSTNATPGQRARALAVLGDWELARRRTDAALEYYRQAFESLHDEQPSLAAEFFAAPQMINFVPPPGPVDWQSNPDAFAWGSIEAKFSVSADGKAANIFISMADPAGPMDALYTRRLAEAQFRPRLVDGEPVATAGVSYRHAFRYPAGR